MILIGIDINRFQAVSFVVTLQLSRFDNHEARPSYSNFRAVSRASRTYFQIITQIVRLASLTFSGGRSLAEYRRFPLRQYA